MAGKRGQAALAPWLGKRLLLVPKLLLLPPLLRLPPGLTGNLGPDLSDFSVHSDFSVQEECLETKTG